jgi:hypothetical protein
VAPVKDLDEVARRYPSRKLTLGAERSQLEFYGTPQAPNAKRTLLSSFRG